MKRASQPDQAPPNFFDLSFRGALPEILRELATRIEREEITADEFEWRLNHEHLHFSARIAMKGKV